MRIRVGDDEDHDFPLTGVTVQEFGLLHRQADILPGPFMRGILAAHPVALQGAVWLCRRRAGQTELRFEDVDFALVSLKVSDDTEDSEEEEPEGKPVPPVAAAAKNRGTRGRTTTSKKS